MIRHIVEYEYGRTLLDRQTLAMLSGRSVNTIRAKCSVVEYRDGKALYDMEQCATILDATRARELSKKAA